MFTRSSIAVLILAAVAGSMHREHQKESVPTNIQDCLGSAKLQGYELDFKVNPFYLRGDFDGDGKADYAFTIRAKKTSPIGLGVCRADGGVSILGAGSSPKFSTVEGDNFMSSEWEVITRQEFQEFSYDKKAAAQAAGEVIAVYWEDGTGYIYWNGNAYRWLQEPAGGPAN